MADVPISGLPAASSASGSDLTVIVQGGTTKQSAVTQFLNALSGASSATLAALTDALAIAQSGTTKQVTVQKVLDAGSGATAASSPAHGDKLLMWQSGVTKTVVASSLPLADSSFAGQMSSVDKVLFDTHTPDGTANALAQFSSTGGLAPQRLLLNGGSGSGLVIDSIWFDPASLSFSGGANTENFNVTVPSGVFSSVPTWGIILPEDPHYNATWLNTDGGNTSTNLVCQLHKIDGTNITGGTKVLFGFWVKLSNTPI